MGSAVDQFACVMKAQDKITDGLWKVTTAKRRTLVPPKGVRLYDTDMDKFFNGDGVTNGGVAEGAKVALRVVPVSAASSGITVKTSGEATNPNTFTWAPAAYLRTGDAITLADGTGAVPSGTTATTYYIKKVGDYGNGKSNAGTTFRIASTRANALANTTLTIASSGTAGFTSVIAGVAAQGVEDVLLINPVSAAVDVYLPYSTTSPNFACTVKRAPTASNDVTVKELDASGNVKASGDMSVDGTAGYVTLKAATADYLELFADASNGVYFTRGKTVTQ